MLSRLFALQIKTRKMIEKTGKNMEKYMNGRRRKSEKTEND
jgi:hypothetical protein